MIHNNTSTDNTFTNSEFYNKKAGLLPFAFLFIITLYFHILMSLDSGDDVYFGSFMTKDNFDVISYLTFRWKTWSARFLSEYLMIFVPHHVHLWRILDTIFWSGSAVLISYLVNGNFYSLKSNTVISLLFLIFPVSILHTAGWGATTINYVWPGFTMLCTFAIWKKYLIENKFSFWTASGFLTLIYSGQSEQCSLVLLVAVIYLFFTYGRNHRLYFLINFVIVALILSIILLSPGNANRLMSEIKWLPYYDNINFIDKIFLGVQHSLNWFFRDGNRLSFILALTVFLGVLCKRAGHVAYFIAGVPLVFLLFRNLPLEIQESVVPYLKFVNQNAFMDDKMEYGPNFFRMDLWFILWLQLLSLFCIITSLFLILDKKCFIHAFVILMSGFMTASILGFSPTLYASNLRIFYLLEISLVVLITYLVKRFFDCYKLKPVYQNIVLYVLIVMALFYTADFMNFLYTI